MSEASAKPPLRLCAMCQQRNSRPCGEGCALSVRDPTWEQYLEREAKEDAGRAALEQG